jgi:hypothetical protein
VANKIDLRLNLPSDSELAAMFDAVPVLERAEVSYHTLRAGVNPLVKRARQLSPRSTKEMRDKRSASQRKQADWDYPLWKTIKLVVRRGRRGAGFAVVGPEWPKGNKAYFNTAPKGRRQIFWGVASGATVPQIRNWIVQAFDETKSQQLLAMKVKLKLLMDQIWKRKHG